MSDAKRGDVKVLVAELVAKAQAEKSSAKYTVVFQTQGGSVMPDSVETNETKRPFKG